MTFIIFCPPTTAFHFSPADTDRRAIISTPHIDHHDDLEKLIISR